MKRMARPILLLAGSMVFLSACAAGSRLYVPGELTRPASGAPRPAGTLQAAVADFSWSGAPGGEIGRDFNHARIIAWKGSPGKAVADLVAGALAENGVGAARVAAGAPDPGNLPVRITGKILRFEVNARPTGGINILSEATVTLTITAEGPNIPVPVEQTVTSSTSLADLFVTPADLHEALQSASNAVAEEAVRKLLEARVFPPSS